MNKKDSMAVATLSFLLPYFLPVLSLVHWPRSDTLLPVLTAVFPAVSHLCLSSPFDRPEFAAGKFSPLFLAILFRFTISAGAVSCYFFVYFALWAAAAAGSFPGFGAGVCLLCFYRHHLFSLRVGASD